MILRIGNDIADINESVEFNVTYAVDDISKFGTKSFSFSKDFVLAGTANNIKIFNEYFNTNIFVSYNPVAENKRNNFNANDKVQCVLIDEDGYTIIDGYLKLNGTVINKGVASFDVTVFSSLLSFADRIKSRLLSEMQMGGLKSRYNLLEVRDNCWYAFSENNPKDVFYFFSDYGIPATSPGDSIKFENIRPAILVKYLIKKIISEAGFEWVNENETDFVKPIYFSSNAKPKSGSSGNSLVQQILTIIDYKRVYSFNEQFYIYNLISKDVKLELKHLIPPSFDDNILHTGEAVGRFDLDTTKVEAGSVGRVDVDVEFDYTHIFGYNEIVLSMAAGPAQDFEGNQIIDVVDNAFLVKENFSSNGNVVGEKKKLTMSFFFDPTIVTRRYIYFLLSVGQQSQSNAAVVRIRSISIKMTNRNEGVPFLINLSYGGVIFPGGMIDQNLKQSDFFSSVINMFNLMVVQDKVEKNKLKIYHWKDFYKKELSSDIDWSAKVDRMKPFVVKPLHEYYAKEYVYNFAEESNIDNDRYKNDIGKQYGERRKNSVVSFGADKNEFKSVFSTAPVSLLNGRHYMQLYKDNGGQKQQVQDLKSKIIFCSPQTVSNYNLQIGPQANNFVTINIFGYGGHYKLDDSQDLLFGSPALNYMGKTQSNYTSNNLYNNYWSSYINTMINDNARFVECFVRLNAKDIDDLDFRRLIHIDGTRYILNKIIDYNPYMRGASFKVELIKHIE